MAEREMTLASQFQHLHDRLATAMAAQVSLDLERDAAQLRIDQAEERQQHQSRDAGRGY